MLSNDIEIIEGYFDFVCIRPSIRDSWNRIKKELSGSGQNSAEETQPQAGTQQLKAKIASLVNKIVAKEKRTGLFLCENEVIDVLRQLSAN